MLYEVITLPSPSVLSQMLSPCQEGRALLNSRPMDSRNIIKRCHLFAGVTDEDLERLAAVGKLRVHEKGEVLFSDGEKALGFYVVGAGKVKIYKLSPEGKERILHIVQPGGTFAEAAIFGNGLYPAYAEPLEKAQLVFFPKNSYNFV